MPASYHLMNRGIYAHPTNPACKCVNPSAPGAPWSTEWDGYNKLYGFGGELNKKYGLSAPIEDWWIGCRVEGTGVGPLVDSPGAWNPAGDMCNQIQDFEIQSSDIRLEIENTLKCEFNTKSTAKKESTSKTAPAGSGNSGGAAAVDDVMNSDAAAGSADSADSSGASATSSNSLYLMLAIVVGILILFIALGKLSRVTSRRRRGPGPGPASVGSIRSGGAE